MDDIWLSFDKTIGACYSSRSSGLMEGLGDMLASLSQSPDLLQYGDFYIWITDNFNNMLLDQNMAVCHHSILINYDILFKILAQDNSGVCNIILDNFLNLLDRVIKPLFSWEDRSAFVVPFNHEQLTIPDGVENVIEQVEISRDSTISSLLSCFFYVMKNNHETVAKFGSCMHHRIMLFLVKTANDSPVLSTKCTSLLLISKFSLQLFSVFTLEHWMDIYHCFGFLEEPGNAALPILKEVFDSFGTLFEKIIYFRGSNFSRIDNLLLTTVLKILVELCKAGSRDVDRWAIITCSFMKLIHASLSQLLGMTDLMEYLQIDETIKCRCLDEKRDLLYSVFGEYFYKCIEYELSFVGYRSPLVFRTINDVWNSFLQQINDFFKSFSNFDIALFQNQVGHFNKIMSIPERLRSLEKKYDRKVIFYDTIEPRTLVDVLTFVKERFEFISEGNPRNVLRLIVLSLGILGESNTFYEDAYFLLLSLWNDNAIAGRGFFFDNGMKLECFRGLCYLLPFMPETPSRAVIEALKALILICAKEIQLCESFAYLLFVLLLKSNDRKVRGYCHAYIKGFTVAENIAFLKSGKLGEILPCILANRCALIRNGGDWIMSCLDCDEQKCSPETNSTHLTHLLETIGPAFVKLFLEENYTGKRYLLKRLGRYIYHCNPLRNLRTISLISDELCKFPPHEVTGCLKLFINLMCDQEKKLNVQFVETIRIKFSNTYFTMTEKQKINWAKTYCNLMIEIPWPASLNPEKNAMLLLIVEDFIQFILKSEDNRYYFKYKLETITKHYGLTMKQLLILFEEELSKIFIYLIVNNLFEIEGNLHFTMSRIASIFDMNAQELLGYRCLPFMISHILTKFNRDQISYFIGELAAVLMTTKKQLIANNFENIFPSIYFNDDEAAISTAFTAIEEFCDNDIVTLVYISYQTLIGNVLLNADKPRKITRFFYTYSKMDFLKEVLMQNIAGFLTLVDGKLLSKTTSRSIKKKCLISLIHLITYMGPEHVLNMRTRLLATLRNGLPLVYDLLPIESCKLWLHFLYSFRSEDLKVLGEDLTSILSLILPLYDRCPYNVGKIFQYLVVCNGHLYAEYLPELDFVKFSTDGRMHSVWLTIQKASKRNELTCSEEIQRTLKHIRNENVESRVHGLSCLNQQLEQYGPILHKLIDQSELLAKIIREIVDCLMENIHSGNSQVKQLCGACIGKLGAINPARFHYRDSDGFSGFPYHPVESDEFAFLCISGVTKGLQKAENSFKFNIIASCIQEILKYYFPESRSSNRESFLQRFPHTEKSILVPLLETRYIFTEPTLPEGIVIGSHAGKTIFQWASHWASVLITYIPADSFSNRFFKFCLPMMLLDYHIMQTLLPYILLKAVVSSNEYHNAIEQEIKLILKWQVEEELSMSLPKQIHVCKMYSKFRTLNDLYSSNSKCFILVLDLLDFLFKSLTVLHDNEVVSTEFTLLQSFLNNFSAMELSLMSYIQGDYCRSLFFYEKGIDQSQNDEVNTAPLRNIYAKLRDADGLLGVMRNSPSLLTSEESVLNHVVSGNIQDAVVGYEKLSRTFPSTECHRGLVQCYLNTNEPYVALKLVEGYMKEGEFFDSTLYNEYCEAICQTMMMDDLPPVLDGLNSRIGQNWSWSVDIAYILSDLFNSKFTAVRNKIDSVRRFIVGSLASVNGTYRQGYDHIVKLQVLDEVEKCCSMLVGIEQRPQPDAISKYIGNLSLDLRPDLLPSDGYFRQTVLNSRQQVLMIAKTLINKFSPNDEQLIDSELGKNALKLVKIARKSGNYQNAHFVLATAENFKPVGLFIEKAKLHKARFETDSAVLVLNRGIQQFFSDISQSRDFRARLMCAEAKLLIAKYNDINMNVDFLEGCKYYSSAVAICETEKNMVFLAHYLYKRICSESQPDNTREKRDIQLEAVRNFAKSLLPPYPSRYIYQSMPCMLSLWLDFGMRLHKQQTSPLLQREEISQREKVMKELNHIVEMFSNILQPYIFMTAFSQLLSRINHPLESCRVILRKIITDILLTYPQQAFWMFAPIMKSADPGHKRMCKAILQEVYLRKPELREFCGTFIQFIDSLINVCNKKIPKGTSRVSLETLSTSLMSLLNNERVKIMIPAQRFRTMSLPHHGYENTKLEHNVFPPDMVYFHSVEDTVQVITSLQRPKKLIFRGSDGLLYPFMCKPMDDLRLDSRIMEFSSVVNIYLQRCPASRDRNLHIRTYSVVPINHECGLIEWLPDLMSFRAILLRMYRGSPMDHKEINEKFKGATSHHEKLAVFNEVLQRHPPVLQKWFFQQFPTPDIWYRARQSFVRTTAVMSVVGYVVGLGDRHGQNILIDTITGDLVHVDFNCLFNKGEQFLYPEIVPFRLTHNMVRAMGPTGIEGTFMKCCEITNRVMRKHSQQLVSVVKPFLYDARSQNKNTDEGSVDKVEKNIMNVQKKLNGVVLTFTKETQPLSVEGQMRGLVEEATNPANLSRMYPAWDPFM